MLDGLLALARSTARLTRRTPAVVAAPKRPHVSRDLLERYAAAMATNRAGGAAAGALTDQNTPGEIPWPNASTDLGLWMLDRRTRQQLASYRGWAYKAITAIANRMSEINFKMELVRTLADGDEERTPVPFHPIYQLLRGGAGSRPNPMVTAQHLRKLTTMDLELTGNAFWLKVKDSLGIPRELWRLRPDKMSPVFNKDATTLLGWAWMSATGYGFKTAAFLRDEVVHFMYPSPFGDPFMGTSPLRSADYAYDIDEAHKKYQRHFFDHGAQLGLVLATEQDLDDEVAEQVLEDFMARYSGVENSWLPIVMGGGLKATPIAAANKELEAVSLMEFTRDDLLSTFGVPKTKLGLAENVNRASAEALDVTFNRETINPRLRSFEEQIEVDLITDYPQPTDEDTRLEAAFDNPVPEDRDFLLTETKELAAAGLLKGNEGRSRHRLKPFTGPYGDQVQVALGITMVDPDSVIPASGTGEEVEPAQPEDTGAEGDAAAGGASAQDVQTFEKGRALVRVRHPYALRRRTPNR